VEPGYPSGGGIGAISIAAMQKAVIATKPKKPNTATSVEVFARPGPKKRRSNPAFSRTQWTSTRRDGPAVSNANNSAQNAA